MERLERMNILGGQNTVSVKKHSEKIYINENIASIFLGINYHRVKK